MAKKVNINELARRYTTAVFDLAKADGKLQRVNADLEAVVELLKTHSGLQKMLGAKTLSYQAQIEAVKDIGKKFDALTLNFLMMIAQNGRLKYLSEIIAAFEDRISQENDELKAEVTSALKLDDKQVAQIAKDLGAKTGKKIKVTLSMRPDIIGGLIIKIGPKMFDYSVKSRLTKLKNKLKESA